ncbi:RNI-like protein [Fomitiporia mediterranea MF3/22]|uniref:RNI-like protein n=1 Tax=Fomitiporia mediterranea (strain MF3/22) TaxID=694068 RepID=UPI00044087D2|nr:RNI-like protein [Fomitiporia mediterranea MF3/22]EJD01637.1 RNI-like protein [Fomitiporia mediterranea MF3/22]
MHSASYPYYESDVTVVPATWSLTNQRVSRPKTPPHSPATHLPPEILIHILRQVHSSRDLYSALLVSRAWCECAVELLWHRPSFSDLQHFVQMLQVISSQEKTFDYARFVRRLNFIYLCRDLTDSLFIRLAKCTKLERLTLVNCVELTDDALMRVLPLCNNLVALDLTNITSCTDRSIIALAQSATRLQGLNLGGCKNITDEGVLAIARNCPLLRRIKLSNVRNITNQAVLSLSTKCPLLLEIDLHGCPKVTDEAIRSLWTNLTHLRDFRLAHCQDLTDLAFPAKPQTNPPETQLSVQPFPNSAPIPSEALPPLRLTRLCEHLRMLDLTACALITDEAVAGIISCAPKIRNLYFAKCSLLTDVAVESICKLGKHLHYLHLGHASSITDRSVRTLARSCTRLRYIDLACCPLLTDLSVFELSGLPKLRRIGLVRVTNLTDQAIFSLADRHSTLERIHLSYCEHITVLAIHFLLQRLPKLTHLSLTGIPAFRRAELQQFCRSPPREFNTNQRAAFCVYSGKGVDNLRLYLAELMAHVQSEAVGENDSDYDAEAEDEFPSSSDQETVGVNTVETPRMPYARDQDWRPVSAGVAVAIATEEVFDISDFGRTSLVPSTVTTVRGRPGRTIVDRTENSDSAALIVEETNPSSVATTPSPTVQQPSDSTPSGPSNTRSRVFGEDLVVEAPTPSPRITPYASRQNACSVPTFSRANSNASDGASNRSARSSVTNKTSNSNGAGFFRNYISGGHSSSDAALTSRVGSYTPDLIYAEIGHGRGNSDVSGPGPSTMQNHQQAGWNSESSRSSANGDFFALRIKNELDRLNESDDFYRREDSLPRYRPSVLADTSNTPHRGGSSRDSASLVRPIPNHNHREHHDPSSPIPYLSSSPTTRELQESVHSALSGSNAPSSSASSTAAAGMIQEDAAVHTDSRGRSTSVRRSLKNTLSAAEHYASALFFRNAGPTNARERERERHMNGNVNVNGGTGFIATNGSVMNGRNLVHDRQH